MLLITCSLLGMLGNQRAQEKCRQRGRPILGWRHPRSFFPNPTICGTFESVALQTLCPTFPHITSAATDVYQQQPIPPTLKLPKQTFWRRAWGGRYCHTNQEGRVVRFNGHSRGRRTQQSTCDTHTTTARFPPTTAGDSASSNSG